MVTLADMGLYNALQTLLRAAAPTAARNVYPEQLGMFSATRLSADELLGALDRLTALSDGTGAAQPGDIQWASSASYDHTAPHRVEPYLARLNPDPRLFLLGVLGIALVWASPATLGPAHPGPAHSRTQAERTLDAALLHLGLPPTNGNGRDALQVIADHTRLDSEAIQHSLYLVPSRMNLTGVLGVANPPPMLHGVLAGIVLGLLLLEGGW